MRPKQLEDLLIRCRAHVEGLSQTTTTIVQPWGGARDLMKLIEYAESTRPGFVNHPDGRTR